MTSLARIVVPLRTLMSAPNPTNTPAISASRNVLHVPPPPDVSARAAHRLGRDTGGYGSVRPRKGLPLAAGWAGP